MMSDTSESPSLIATTQKESLYSKYLTVETKHFPDVKKSKLLSHFNMSLEVAFGVYTVELSKMLAV
jgi:hypothetical protein